jgi:serine protease Do
MRTLLAMALLGALVTGMAGTALPPQKPDREKTVRDDKAKVEAEGYWLYNNLPKAFAEAKTTGKPIIVVLRCLPCDGESCVRLDDGVIEASTEMKGLLDKFVRVRIVGTNGLDLSLFQYDTDQSFAVFLLNSDGTIYGRYGTRSQPERWHEDVSVEGMAKALEGALALHKKYPANRASLVGKHGPTPEFARPELYPSLQPKYTANLDYDGKVVPSCIHCHMISDAKHDVALKRWHFTDSDLFPFPHPRALGLILDPKQRPTVLRTEPGSDAEKAGFRPGDVLQTLEGQTLLSTADIQWVLNAAPETGATLKAGIVRSGKPQFVALTLSPGWRKRDDFSWRVSTWGLRREALGGMKLDPNPNGDGLLVAAVGKYAPNDLAKRAGVQVGDILVGFDTLTRLPREADLIAYALQKKKPGDTISLNLLRHGETVKTSLVLPTP